MPLVAVSWVLVEIVKVLSLFVVHQTIGTSQ